MNSQQKKSGGIKQFSPQFWLVIMFEFFERGSYYGMMSILSVYLTDHLHFAKESVGLIKGTIQPLLYFLPIISGALADRFGYRKTLMVAFSFLGLGYFLTSQATGYALVFGALVIMGMGAGTFKPIISGTIARVTTKENSTLGFGIYYWSINLGAFLFPLLLVPFLKKMNWSYVIIAAAIGTAIMLLPTFFFYKDPVKSGKATTAKQTNLIQTLANAFEIIYSPIVLLFNVMKRSVVKRFFIFVLLLAVFAYALTTYFTPPASSQKFSRIGVQRNSTIMLFEVNRNMLAEANFQVSGFPETPNGFLVTIFKPLKLTDYSTGLLAQIHKHPGFESIGISEIQELISLSDQKIELTLLRERNNQKDFSIDQVSENHYVIELNKNQAFRQIKSSLLRQLQQNPWLAGIQDSDLENLYQKSKNRPFFLLYLSALILIGLGIIFLSRKQKSPGSSGNPSHKVAFAAVFLFGFILWILPGLSMLGRIVTFIIYFSLTSLFIIDKSDSGKFIDHAKFLLMIFLYSGFWILYFQMFDSVLWYVQAYVDATNLNHTVNNLLGFFGIHIDWFFDIEHVTVINAGTIILLQLVISNIVKKTRALPTMVAGITLGTIGMAILSISVNIWVFLMGIILFSIGEMTAHPKFISYIGIIAPTDKKAMYMGYLFLYGVFGSSIGGILGAKLYVHFVDNLNQPRILWLVFSGIGVVTIVALLLYNKFLSPKEISTTSST